MRSQRLLVAPLIFFGCLCPGASSSLAVTSALETAEVLEPGITLRLVCAAADASCAFQDPNGFVVDARALQDDASRYDAAGFQLIGGGESGGPCGPCTFESAFSHATLARWHPDGTVRPLLRFRGTCNGSIGEDKFVYAVRVDAIRGTALFWVGTRETQYISGGTNSCTSVGGADLDELIEISGLPSVMDILRGLSRGLTRPRGER